MIATILAIWFWVKVLEILFGGVFTIGVFILILWMFNASKEGR